MTADQGGSDKARGLEAGNWQGKGTGFMEVSHESGVFLCKGSVGKSNKYVVLLV